MEDIGYSDFIKLKLVKLPKVWSLKVDPQIGLAEAKRRMVDLKEVEAVAISDDYDKLTKD